MSLTDPRPTDTFRQPVALWVLAACLAILGFTPLSTLLGFGPPKVWWWGGGWTGDRQGALPQGLMMSAGLVGMAVLIALALRDRLDAIVARVEDALQRPTDRAFGAALVVLSTALTAAVARYAFHGQLWQGDEFSQGFQTRVLLSGRLSATPEVYREFFNTTETYDLGARWFSQFPIGHASFLALGSLVGAAWLVNPLFMGWTARNLYRFAAGITDERTARWIGLLGAVTPFAVLLAATQMNHAPALAFITWGLAALPRWTRATDAPAVRRSAIVIGLAFATAATIRPFDAALTALAVGVFQLAHARHSALHRRALAWQLAGGLLPLTLLCLANVQTTGSPLLFGYDLLNTELHRPGFHRDPRGSNDHTPLRGLYYASHYLIHLQYSLFEAPIPALVFVCGGLVAARPATGWDRLMAGFITVLLIGYMTYWHEGYLLGAPRFLHAAIPAFVWFAARGPRALARARWPVVRRSAILILPLAMGFAWLAPVNLRRYFGVWSNLEPYHAPDGPGRPDVVADARAAGLTNALVFVRESWHGTLAARLRALGSPPLLTEEFVRTRDACAIQTALDAVPPGTLDPRAVVWVYGQADAAGMARALPATVDQRDRSLSLVPDRPLTPECRRELALDEMPAVPYALLLASASFDADGRLGGDVVFARSIGVRDTLLRARFGDREWYRYDARRAGVGSFTPVAK